MKVLYEQNYREIHENNLNMSSAIHLRHGALERNKRCLLAYINHRYRKKS